MQAQPYKQKLIEAHKARRARLSKGAVAEKPVVRRVDREVEPDSPPEKARGGRPLYSATDAVQFVSKYHLRRTTRSALRIIEAVAAVTGFSVDAIVDYGRRGKVSDARHIACYVLYQAMADSSLNWIADRLGVNHTSVHYAIHKVHDDPVRRNKDVGAVLQMLGLQRGPDRLAKTRGCAPGGKDSHPGVGA
jgi:hypothetical protein